MTVEIEEGVGPISWFGRHGVGSMYRIWTDVDRHHTSAAFVVSTEPDGDGFHEWAAWDTDGRQIASGRALSEASGVSSGRRETSNYLKALHRTAEEPPAPRKQSALLKPIVH